MVLKSPGRRNLKVAICMSRLFRMSTKERGKTQDDVPRHFVSVVIFGGGLLLSLADYVFRSYREQQIRR
jgi:hypothetical protein